MSVIESLVWDVASSLSPRFCWRGHTDSAPYWLLHDWWFVFDSREAPDCNNGHSMTWRVTITDGYRSWKPLRTLCMFWWFWGISRLFSFTFKPYSTNPLLLISRALRHVKQKKTELLISFQLETPKKKKKLCKDMGWFSKTEGLQHWILACWWAFLEFCIWSRSGSYPNIADLILSEP